MNVISASRRTDIPAWYGPWFMNRIEAGYAVYRNPFGGQHHRVSLAPEEVIAFVFWTKNPAPFLPHLEKLLSLDYKACFHVTITGYGSHLEEGVPPWPKVAKNFKALTGLLNPESVRWRYDPVLMARGFDRRFHLKNFTDIASRLEGLTDTCHTSFVQFYKKTARNIDALGQRTGICIADPEDKEKIDLAVELKAIAAERGIRLLSCCAPLLRGADVKEGGCVDAELIRSLRPDLAPLKLKPRPTRDGCLCVESRDIGAYDSCLGGCVYCYANQNTRVAGRRFAGHDPASETLA